LPRDAPRKTIQPRHRLDKLPPRHILIEPVCIRTVTDIALGRRQPSVVAADAHRAKIRLNVAARQAQQRAFPRALVAGKAVNSGPQLQGHLIDTDNGAIPFRNTIKMKNGVREGAAPAEPFRPRLGGSLALPAEQRLGGSLALPDEPFGFRLDGYVT